MTSILIQATVAVLNGSLGSTDVAVRNISVSHLGKALGSRGCLRKLVLTQDSIHSCQQSAGQCSAAEGLLQLESCWLPGSCTPCNWLWGFHS